MADQEQSATIAHWTAQSRPSDLEFNRDREVPDPERSHKKIGAKEYLCDGVDG